MSNARSNPRSLLRWRRNPVSWIETHLYDPETGKRFRLLPAEREFLKHVLATGSDGRLLYPEMIFGAIKKSGKTGFAAILMLTILLLYGGRYAEGYCVANDLDQAMGRVFEAVRRIVEASPLLKPEAMISIDRIVFAATGATIRALASDYASAAGGHPTISVFDEMWAYSSERARRLYDELVPVPTRQISCRLVVTHAGFEGEGQLLQELYNRGMAQPEVGPSLHAGDGMLMAWHHEPIAPWQDERWLADMRRSLRPNQYLRMCENRFVTTESTFVDLAWWDACVDPTLLPVLSDKTLPAWVGVDASVKRDTTAIVAVTFDTKSQRLRLIAHRIFQPTATQPLDFEATIEATVKDFCRRFAVRGVHYDPYQMAAVAQRLQTAGVPMREFPQTVSNLTAMGSTLHEVIKGARITVYKDDALRLAVSRTVAKETPRGLQLTKEKQSHKIDVVIALAMATLHAVEQGAYEQTTFVEPILVSRPYAYFGDVGNVIDAPHLDMCKTNWPVW